MGPPQALHGYHVYGKRSAEPFYGYGAALTFENRNNVHGHDLASGYAISQPHPGLSTSYQQRTQLHSGYGKRSAEPFYGYSAGIALHPGVATSFVARSPQGLHGYHVYGKRSADADAFYGYGYGHAAGVLNNNVHSLSHFGSGYGISQLHPSGHSFQHTSRLHKREAEAEPEADAYYGYYGHGYGLGYGHGYGHGLGYHGLGYSHGGYYGHGYGHGYGYGYHG